MSVVPDINVKINSKLLHLAAMQMDGFCEYPHAVPPILVCLRAFAELLMRELKQQQPLSEVEFCYILGGFWNIVQTAPMLEQIGKIVQVTHHDPAKVFNMTFGAMAAKVVHEYMQKHYLPKHAPHLITRSNAEDAYDLDYVTDLDFDLLGYINRWIEADQIPAVEIVVAFSVWWRKRNELSKTYIGYQMRRYDAPVVQQVKDLHQNMRQKHSILPYTKKDTALFFEAPTVS